MKQIRHTHNDDRQHFDCQSNFSNLNKEIVFFYATHGADGTFFTHIHDCRGEENCVSV